MNTAVFVIQQLVNALSLGSIYALVAIGLAMVFGILRLINFAHGEVMMVGAYGFLFMTGAGTPVWFGLILTVAVAILTGLLMERIAYRPVRGAPEVTILLTSFAVSTFLQNSSILIASPRSRPFPTPAILNGTLTLGELVVSRVNAFGIVAAAALMILVTLFVTRTMLGTAMRATAEDLLAARLVGIRINRVIMGAFALGSTLAAVAGLLWASRAGKIDPLMGFTPVLKAFVAAVVGGFGSIPGAVVGAYVIGAAEVLLQGLLPSGLASFRDAFVFILLILFLLVRPQGLLGSTEGEKV